MPDVVPVPVPVPVLEIEIEIEIVGLISEFADLSGIV
jgi:hypothetical protein